ncbi:hypothetical protein SELMODRAFT_427601 [Selaginella moellendorffii]|uniref:Amidohydrolase 3 domain-containing protein n=1 Tax=Selaginella moellendorffii TaxID=88036 RepID=D8T049_SELML|nr:hypothetical protein SELMODRAFT_427601 [Selaginella moellendorffii]
MTVFFRDSQAPICSRFSRLEPRLESRCSRLEPREKKEIFVPVLLLGTATAPRPSGARGWNQEKKKKFSPLYFSSGQPQLHGRRVLEAGTTTRIKVLEAGTTTRIKVCLCVCVFDAVFIAEHLRATVSCGSSESTWRNPHSRGENTSGWSHPEERISAWDVVAGYTSSAVYAAALEDLVGSLTPGNFADFVVLSESPFGQGTGIFPPVHICEKIGEEKAARIIKQLVKTFKGRGSPESQARQHSFQAKHA